MIEDKNKFNDRDFQNYQRILTGHPATVLTIMGLSLTLTAGAFGGIFVIATKNFNNNLEKWLWLLGLGFLILIATFILYKAWFREHILFKQTIEDLKKEGIKFPNTAIWRGVTFKCIRFIYRIMILIWVILIIFSFYKISESLKGEYMNYVLKIIFGFSYLAIMLGSYGLMKFVTKFPLSSSLDNHELTGRKYFGLNGKQLWKYSWVLIIFGTLFQLIRYLLINFNICNYN